MRYHGFTIFIVDVNFAGFNHTVQSGSGVLIETGGSITEDLIYLKVTP